MSLLSSLFKTKKVNLTPDISYPTQEQLYYTPKLREITDRRLSGQDLGFGEDFLSKTANPVIAQREARFKNEDVPFLNSQLSARGVGRSAGKGLATDILGKASSEKTRDIDEIMSKFYLLDQQQRKADFGQALDVSRYMQDQQLGIKNNQASASERLANATAADARARESRDTELAGKAVATGASFLAPFAPANSALQTALSGVGGGMYSLTKQQAINMSPEAFLDYIAKGAQANILK